jgi:two-component system sensor histidine kinase KdpD
MASERRTSPEDFLRLIEKAKRGRLKIYIGHAAGVGKTYQMLEDAHALRKRGVDVVVGAVETHGRSETAEKLEGLPLIPRRRVPYKGKDLEEMDLPAILGRRPEIVIVDELAHTNVPGVEHEKRFQDVEEILEAGISVMTAVNIQHVESLVDVVAKATGVDVRERVPDRLVRQADAIVNVDLPSEELLQRLREGKIYPAGRITPALENFFRTENLASLRELAMRSIADRLEADRRASIPDQEPGAIGTKVLVAISSNAATTRQLLRRGSSIAGRMNTNWYAAYVRTPGEHPNRMSARDHRLLSENVTLAMELGAKVVWLNGKNVARELFAFASQNSVTLAVFGKSRRSWLRRLAFRSPIDVFVRVGSGIDVFEIETTEGERARS